jgi:glycosyltransferase involved in cell wall biosynthesis
MGCPPQNFACIPGGESHSSSKPRQILDLWAHVDPRFGGVGPAAASLATAIQSGSEWRSEMVAVCNRNEQERHRDIPGDVQMICEEGPRPLAEVRLIRPLKQAIRNSDVCHIHGVWLAHSVVGAHLARELQKPLVWSTHGMLETWDLTNKRLKKRVYSWLFQRRALQGAGCLRALSEQEASDYRSYGLKNPIAIVPNGVAPLDRVDPDACFQKYPFLNGKKIVLFLSRIHRKKGIFELLRAWPSVVAKHGDAHLLVAGADFENDGDIARQIVQRLGTSGSVTFCGVLNGVPKLGALSASTLFCLPSHSEGMSIAVLEALSIGLPVVITKACNVGGVGETGSGYLTAADPDELAENICAGLSLTQAGWRSMSDSARLLARDRYTWPHLGDAMKSVYEWLLGGPRPACVMR